MSVLASVIGELQQENPLPPANRDHALKGAFVGSRECHVQPDWLLVYRVDHGQLILVLQRTGTHTDLM